MKSLAIKLSKVCNDLRLLSSGPRCGLREINLPPKQPGSSIMPGKVNPVIPEVVNMVCFRVIGSDLTVSMAAEGGQLQLNVFEPVIAACIFEAQTMFINAARTLRVHCVDGITANAEVCRHYVDYSIGTVTALNPVIGYDRVDRACEGGHADRERNPGVDPREETPHRGADRPGARPGNHDGTGPQRMNRAVIAPTAVVALAGAIWFSPVPEGLTAPAWHLFAIFAATIVAVVADAIPILTASVIAVAAAVLTGTLPPEQGLLWFFQRNDSSDRARLPGGARRRHVRSGTAHRLCGCECVRTIHIGTVL